MRTARAVGAPVKNSRAILPCSRQGLPSTPCHHDMLWALTLAYLPKKIDISRTESGPLFSPFLMRLMREAQYVVLSIKTCLPQFFYTLAFTLYRVSPMRRKRGIVSVALSLGLPLVAVSNCHANGYCPDFPLSTRVSTERSTDNLALLVYSIFSFEHLESC